MSDDKQYFNPDPLVHLIGEASEASVYMNGIKCTALIDSGAQMSTITISFAKQLGLPIHHLNRTLSIEAMGEGRLPIWDMWKFMYWFLGLKLLMMMCLHSF